MSRVDIGSQEEYIYIYNNMPNSQLHQLDRFMEKLIGSGARSYLYTKNTDIYIYEPKGNNSTQNKVMK